MWLNLWSNERAKMKALSSAQLRNFSSAELARLGEDSLGSRLLDQADYAHQKHQPRSLAELELLLKDPECVRYPVRLAFEFGEMAMHQFAQPDVDYRHADQNGRVLYLRPVLRDRPELIVPAVAYMLPVINYGEIIQDEHCMLYGATLLGLMEEEFYARICALADFVQAEVMYQSRRPRSGGEGGPP
jgi:hypothetical protein